MTHARPTHDRTGDHGDRTGDRPDGRPDARPDGGETALDAPNPGDRRWGAPSTAVPPGADPSRCPYCERPFPTDRRRTLHLGDAHTTALTDEEAEAVAAVRDDEADDLFVYHLKVVAAIVLLLMGLAYVYAFVLS